MEISILTFPAICYGVFVYAVVGFLRMRTEKITRGMSDT